MNAGKDIIVPLTGDALFKYCAIQRATADLKSAEMSMKDIQDFRWVVLTEPALPRALRELGIATWLSKLSKESDMRKSLDYVIKEAGG